LSDKWAKLSQNNSLVRYILINEKRFVPKCTTLGTTFLAAAQIKELCEVVSRNNLQSKTAQDIRESSAGSFSSPNPRSFWSAPGLSPFFFVMLDLVTGGREIKIAFPIGPRSTVRMKVLPVGFGMGCNQGCNPFNHKMKNHVTVFSFGLGGFIGWL